MSAFLCTPQHIAAIATWAEKRGLVPDRKLTAYRLAKENIASIAYRYPDTADDVVGKWMNMEEDDYFEDCVKKDSFNRPGSHIHSLARSLAYQSCEHPEWDASEAKRIIDLVLEDTAGLPQMGGALWEI